MSVTFDFMSLCYSLLPLVINDLLQIYSRASALPAQCQEQPGLGCLHILIQKAKFRKLSEASQLDKGVIFLHVHYLQSSVT